MSGDKYSQEAMSRAAAEAAKALRAAADYPRAVAIMVAVMPDHVAERGAAFDGDTTDFGKWLPRIVEFVRAAFHAGTGTDVDVLIQPSHERPVWDSEPVYVDLRPGDAEEIQRRAEERGIPAHQLIREAVLGDWERGA